MRSVANFSSAWEQMDQILPASAAVKNMRSWLSQQTWPERTHEDYKYTSFSKVTDLKFTLALPEKFNIHSQNEFHEIHFVNGTLLSTKITDPGIALSLKSDDYSLLANSAGGIGRSDNFFVALNRSMGGGSYLLEISANIRKPILINYIQVGDQSQSTTQPRVLVKLKEFAGAEILEAFHSSKSEAVFFNRLLEGQLEAGSSLHHYRLQDDSQLSQHFESCQIEVGKDASYASWHFNLGGKLARDYTSVYLNDTGAFANVSGLYLTDGNRQHEHHIEVHHEAKHTSSRQLFKGILKDTSRGVFNGRIFVAKNASQVSATQLNNNLLLSTEAEVDTKPELSIENDDVKCSHGATVGQLDSDQIFYLNTRGISTIDSQRILAKAFIDEVLYSVPNVLIREKITQTVGGYLNGRQ